MGVVEVWGHWEKREQHSKSKKAQQPSSGSPLNLSTPSLALYNRISGWKAFSYYRSPGLDFGLFLDPQGILSSRMQPTVEWGKQSSRSPQPWA